MTRQGLCQYLSTNGNGMKDLTWKHLFAGTRDFMACNHLRSYKYYSDSIIYPDGFLGYSCTSYDVFESVSTSQSLRMDCVKNSCSFLFIHLKSSLLMVAYTQSGSVRETNAAVTHGHLSGYVKKKSLAGWITLLMDVFGFARDSASHAQQRDARIWVTMQTGSKGKLTVTS